MSREVRAGGDVGLVRAILLMAIKDSFLTDKKKRRRKLNARDWLRGGGVTCEECIRFLRSHGQSLPSHEEMMRILEESWERGDTWGDWRKLARSSFMSEK